MNVCLLIAGLPASGKSTFARLLERELGIPCLSKDAIKETLFDTLGFASRAEKVRLGEAAYRIQLDIAESMMRARQTLALENNFEDSSRAPLAALLARQGYTPATLMFDGDLAEIHRRFLARDQSPERHRGHVVNTCYPETSPSPYVPLSFEAFAAGMDARGYRRFDVGGPRMTVDTTHIETLDWTPALNWVRGLLDSTPG